MKTHEQLCMRARQWLRGSCRCNPVFSNLASCSEIPDAIGWSSAYQWRGSIVVECKTSMADFYADRRKFQLYQHPNEKWAYSLDRINKAHAEKEGLKIIEVPRMGDWRLFLCEPGIISAELVSKHAPDHGLLYLEGRRARVIKPAIRRADVAKDAEIRYLRFAIINGKNPYEGMSANQAQLTLGGEREAEQGKP